MHGNRHPWNPSRRALLAAALALTGAAVAGCTKAVQGAQTLSGQPGSATPAGAISDSAITDSATGGSAGPDGAPATRQLPRVTAGTTGRPTPTPGGGSTSAGPTGSDSRSGNVTGTGSRTATRPTPVPTASAARTTASTPAHRGPATEVAHGPKNRPQVALTFHGAGDVGLAREILQIAAAKRARITVMAVGTWLADNPGMGNEILAGGNDLGNHTLSHADINSMTMADMRAEVVGCRNLLVRTTGSPGRYFRQSQSQTANDQLKLVAGEAGYPITLSYDLDSMDWTDPGAQAVRQNAAAAGPGSIVSMHLGHSDTVRALPGILDDLRSRGLTAVTVSTLLAG